MTTMIIITRMTIIPCSSVPSIMTIMTNCETGTNDDNENANNNNNNDNNKRMLTITTTLTIIKG